MAQKKAQDVVTFISNVVTINTELEKRTLDAFFSFISNIVVIAVVLLSLHCLLLSLFISNILYLI